MGSSEVIRLSVGADEVPVSAFSERYNLSVSAHGYQPRSDADKKHPTEPELFACISCSA